MGGVEEESGWEGGLGWGGRRVEWGGAEVTSFKDLATLLQCSKAQCLQSETGLEISWDGLLWPTFWLPALLC